MLLTSNSLKSKITYFKLIQTAGTTLNAVVLYCYGLSPFYAVTNDSNKTELLSVSKSENSEADRIVDGMDFGELCNEFECISSPSVEATARQLARDILELRQGNRALGTFAVSVKYSVPSLCLFAIVMLSEFVSLIYVLKFYSSSYVVKEACEKGFVQCVSMSRC